MEVRTKALTLADSSAFRSVTRSDPIIFRQDDPTTAPDFNEPDFIFRIRRKMVVVDLNSLAEFPQRLSYDPLTKGTVDEEN